MYMHSMVIVVSTHTTRGEAYLLSPLVAALLCLFMVVCFPCLLLMLLLLLLLLFCCSPARRLQLFELRPARVQRHALRGGIRREEPDPGTQGMHSVCIVYMHSVYV